MPLRSIVKFKINSNPRSSPQQSELVTRIVDALAVDAGGTHQPGNGLAVLGDQHFFALGYSVEEARKVVFAFSFSCRACRLDQGAVVTQCFKADPLPRVAA